MLNIEILQLNKKLKGKLRMLNKKSIFIKIFFEEKFQKRMIKMKLSINHIHSIRVILNLAKPFMKS